VHPNTSVGRAHKNSRSHLQLGLGTCRRGIRSRCRTVLGADGVSFFKTAKILPVLTGFSTSALFETKQRIPALTATTKQYDKFGAYILYCRNLRSCSSLLWDLCISRSINPVRRDTGRIRLSMSGRQNTFETKQRAPVSAATIKHDKFRAYILCCRTLRSCSSRFRGWYMFRSTSSVRWDTGRCRSGMS
jgi:hypothetical protein